MGHQLADEVPDSSPIGGLLGRRGLRGGCEARQKDGKNCAEEFHESLPGSTDWMRRGSILTPGTGRQGESIAARFSGRKTPSMLDLVRAGTGHVP